MTRDELLAAEYVIGTLDAAERAEVRTRIAVDISFAARVRAWERALAPLYELVTPVAPPPGLWHIISEDLDDTRGGVLAVLRGRGRKSHEPPADAAPAAAPASAEGRAKRRGGGKRGALQAPFHAVKGLVRGLRRQAPASEVPPSPPEPSSPPAPEPASRTRSRPAPQAARFRAPAPEVVSPAARTKPPEEAMTAPPVPAPAPLVAVRSGVAALPERAVAPGASDLSPVSAATEAARTPGSGVGAEAPPAPLPPQEAAAPEARLSPVAASTPEVPPPDAAGHAMPEVPAAPADEDLGADTGSGLGELPLLLSLEEIIAPEPEPAASPPAGRESDEASPHSGATDEAPSPAAPAEDAQWREHSPASEPAADGKGDDAPLPSAVPKEAPEAVGLEGIQAPATSASAGGEEARLPLVWPAKDPEARLGEDIPAPPPPEDAAGSDGRQAPAALLGADRDAHSQDSTPVPETALPVDAGAGDGARSGLTSSAGHAPLEEQPLSVEETEDGSARPGTSAPEPIRVADVAEAAVPLVEAGAPSAEAGQNREETAPDEPRELAEGAVPNAEAGTPPVEGQEPTPAASADAVPEGGTEASPSPDQPSEEPRWVPAWPLLSRGPVKQVIPAMVGPKGVARAQRVAGALREGNDEAPEASPAPERQPPDVPMDLGAPAPETPPVPAARPAEREEAAARGEDGPRRKVSAPAEAPPAEAQDRPEEAGEPARAAVDAAADDNISPVRRLEPEPSAPRYRRLLWGALALVVAMALAVGSDLLARWRGDGVPQPRTVTLEPVFVANPPSAVRLRFDPRTGRAEVRVDAPPAPPGRIYSLRLSTEKTGTHLLGTFASSFDAVADLGLLLGGNPPGSARLSVTLDSLDTPSTPGEEVYDSRIVD